MTPFKPKHMFSIHDPEDRDHPMLSSPPRSSPAPKLPSAKLFGDDLSSDANPLGTVRKEHARRRFTPLSRPGSSSSESCKGAESVLRPLDLNAATSGSSADSVTGTPNRRKRPSEPRPAGREDMMWEDSDEDMFQSPRASPNEFRTLDGRTVTSKNPFSPYTPADDSLMAEDSDAGLTPTQASNAPQFPSFGSISDASSTAKASHTGRPPIALRRREPNCASEFRQTYFGPTPDGFPERDGRYSFTGSPIEEVDVRHYQEPHLEQTAATKVRRLHHYDTSVSRRRMFVNTDQANQEDAAKSGDFEEISPTDVLSFPPPPTPMKAARPMYTPLRNVPPQTPALERRARPNDDDDQMNIITSASKQPKSRFNQDFDIIGTLGNGSFGTVYKCLSRIDGCLYAVKAAKRQAKGNADRDRMLKEVYALAALSDQADTAAFHIVRYHQAWMEENRLYIQTELCSYTLDTEIKRGPLMVPRRYKLLREILLALEFIHRNGMVHLDIKPENIFVKNDQYKLGDFGLVSKVGHHDVEEGDSRYMSMELLSGDHNDLTKSDIFSMGATIYEICLGRDLPMDGQEWQNIRSGSLQPLKDTPFAMEVIIKEMMHPDQNLRPHPSQLLKKNELLSDEQKQLLAEKQKVFQVNMALALQTERMKKLTPPRPGGLLRSNTWNGSLPKWI